MGSALSGGKDKVQPASPEKDAGSTTADTDETPYVKSRRCTDVICILLFLIFFIPLVGLLIYCMRYGDIYRILNGYDRCGNICGRVTERFGVEPNDPRFMCFGADMTQKKFLLVSGAGIRDSVDQESNVNRECVNSCSAYPGHRQFFNRCLPEKTTEQVNVFISKTGLSNFFQEVSEDMDLCWKEILALFFVALGFTLVLMFCLRFAVRLVVWVMLGAAIIVTLVATAYLWVKWAGQRDKLKQASRFAIPNTKSDVEIINVNSYLGYAIVASIISGVVLLLIIGLRSKIRLVVQLFKEAGRAIADMPALLALPWITFICVGIAIVIWFCLALIIESSGMLTSENNVNFNYKKDGAMMFTRWYNLVALFWVTQFFIGCQHMTVAGAVCFWYFSRRKTGLGSPVASSMVRTGRYHLGSVAFGSLLVAIVQFARVILQSIYNTVKQGEGNMLKTNLAKVCGCCLAIFEKFLSFINRNAYIEVALRSTNFLESSHRAIAVIGANALRVAAINSVGDFVLFLGKVAVTLATMLVGIVLIQDKEGVQHVWVPITLASLFAYLVAHSFMTVYEMCIDTIFICFCEDCDINDGVAKPFFMSRALMDFVDESDPNKSPTRTTRPSSAKTIETN